MKARVKVGLTKNKNCDCGVACIVANSEKDGGEWSRVRMMFPTLISLASRTMSPKVVKAAMAKGVQAQIAKVRHGKRAPPPVEMDNPEYYFEGGLRRVKPYRQTYLAHVKQRWINRTVPQVFASEMPRRCTESMIVMRTI